MLRKLVKVAERRKGLHLTYGILSYQSPGATPVGSGYISEYVRS